MEDVLANDCCARMFLPEFLAMSLRPRRRRYGRCVVTAVRIVAGALSLLVLLRSCRAPSPPKRRRELAFRPVSFRLCRLFLLRLPGAHRGHGRSTSFCCRPGDDDLGRCVAGERPSPSSGRPARCGYRTRLSSLSGSRGSSGERCGPDDPGRVAWESTASGSRFTCAARRHDTQLPCRRSGESHVEYRHVLRCSISSEDSVWPWHRSGGLGMATLWFGALGGLTATSAATVQLAVRF